MQQISETTPIQHVKEPLPIGEIGELLIKHYGLHQGFFDISIEFGFGFGAVGPTPEATVPGVVLGVNKIGLIQVTAKGANTLDASVVNPKKAPSRKKSRVSSN